jgi:Amt family ammonium transporter
MRKSHALLAAAVLMAAETALAASGAASGPQPGRELALIDVVVLCLAGSLVFFMQAGFAFLESGLSRAKNNVNVLMKNFLDMCFGATVFWAVGYGLLFGFNPSGWFGTSDFFLQGLVGSGFAFFFYQMMFAATAATIVSGAIAERAHFKAYIIGSMGIAGLIYPVYGSWVWGGWHGGSGWLADMGFIDFAGSTVVHSIGGWCALAALIVIKPRLGRYAPDGTPRNIPGHNLSSATLGALILWLGWFGFNGGSVALLTGGTGISLGQVVVNTHLGGTAGALGAIAAMVFFRNKILLTVVLNGSVAGLVSVTAGCHVMTPGFALLTGFVAGILVSVAEALLIQIRIDDVVGAVAVHLVGGIWGTIAAGLFNAKALFSLDQVGVQLIGVVAAGVWAFPVALAMYWLIDKVVGLRATSLQEQRGLDFTEHAEVGYPEFQQEIVHSGKPQ